MSSDATPRPWILQATPWPWGFYPATAFDIVVEEVRGEEGCEYEHRTEIASIHNAAVGGKEHHPSASEAEANAALIVEAVNNYDRLQSELTKAREALEDVANPIHYLRKYAESQERELDDTMARRLSEDVNFVKEIARKALSRITPPVKESDNVG